MTVFVEEDDEEVTDEGRMPVFTAADVAGYISTSFDMAAALVDCGYGICPLLDGTDAVIILSRACILGEVAADDTVVDAG